MALDRHGAEGVIPVAAYVRMSTEHQRYSIQNQLDVIVRYAKQNGMEIVRTYSDRGKSGLGMGKRVGLTVLLEEVKAQTGNFEAILVFDVSRWGRFQDTDESAYYEFICRAAGYSVHYCAEQFENDGSPVSTIVKTIKRAMAAEYSRELSHKVFAGQARVVQKGFRMGGPPGFGLRRCLVDEYGNPKGILPSGARKNLQTEHVILVPGPASEIEIINRMYRWFVDEGLGLLEIIGRLNEMGIKTDRGRPWTIKSAKNVLTNEKYIGNSIFNRKSFKLQKKIVINSRDKWVRKDGAFEAIVDQKLFYAAQEIFRKRSPRFSNEYLLEKLRSLLTKHGYITSDLVDSCLDTPCSETYISRFGDMAHAYSLIGYSGVRDFRYVSINRKLRHKQAEIRDNIVNLLQSHGADVVAEPSSGLIRINDEFTVAVDVMRHFRRRYGSVLWQALVTDKPRPDLTVSARLDRSNEDVLDYYVFPSVIFGLGVIRICEHNELALEALRMSDLNRFCELIERKAVLNVSHPKSAGSPPKLDCQSIHPAPPSSSVSTRGQRPGRRINDIILSQRKVCSRLNTIAHQAEIASNRLDEICTTLSNLYRDEHFETLLRAEGLQEMPCCLADHLAGAHS